MSVILKEKITGPAAWKGPDIAADPAWLYHFTPDDIAVLDAALATLKARGRAFPRFGAQDFPIAPLVPRLTAFADELENGRGFKLLRGLPVERYSDAEINAITYGIGLHLGQPVCQNPRGDLLGEVSLPDKMTYVEQFAVKKRRFSFRDLLESQPGKVHVIVTFLAILELMKTGKIRISQEELFGDILIESLEDEDTVVVPYTDETDSEDKTDGRTEQE